MQADQIYEWCLDQTPEQYWDDCTPLVELAQEQFDVDESDAEELEELVRAAIIAAQS